MKSVFTLAAAFSVALAFTFVDTSPAAAQTEIVIDNFSSTGIGGPYFLSDPGFSSFGEMPPSGVIGAGSTTRTVTITRTNASGSVTAGVVPGVPGLLQGGASNTATGQLTTSYTAGGGLNANLSSFLGVAVDVATFGAGVPPAGVPVSVTLTDGDSNSSTGMATITGTGELLIPPSAFAGLNALDLSDIDSIDVVFDISFGQDFEINSIVALTPEPVTILLWSCGLFGFGIFWKKFGHRIRKAEAVAA